MCEEDGRGDVGDVDDYGVEVILAAVAKSREMLAVCVARMVVVIKCERQILLSFLLEPPDFPPSC